MSIAVLVVILVLVPSCIAVFLGLFAFPNLSPDVFDCQRCDRTFDGSPHRGLPRACPRCGATDWNAG